VQDESGSETAGVSTAETRYLLQHWQLTVSARGIVRAAPSREVVRVEELAALLTLLGRTCDAGFPRVLLLDLSAVRIVGDQWSLLPSLIAGFADGIGAHYRVIAGHDRPIAAVCLFRHGHI
jgi:hypothetical protein